MRMPLRGVSFVAGPTTKSLSVGSKVHSLSFSPNDILQTFIVGKIPGMEGLDLAFYKHRAYYHTPRDSIPFMGYRDAKRALWAMLDGVRDAGAALLNVETDQVYPGSSDPSFLSSS